MSSTLRLSIITVLVLATAALGLIAYGMNQPKPVEQVTQGPTSGYLVAAHPLPAGALARETDFEVRSVPSDSVPTGAIPDTADARIGLRGSLVRKFLDTGTLITSQNIVRPQDRGFLASVLIPGSRVTSINVDAGSGVWELIWPGDYVDVVLTQVIDKADLAHRTLSETVLQNVRVIAIDQEIAQGGSANNATPGKPAQGGPANNATADKLAQGGPANNATAGKHTVSLQLAPEQVKKVTVAKHLGALSLVLRAGVEQQDTEDTGTMFSCDVSPGIARQSDDRQSATVVVNAGGKVTEYSVKKHNSSGCREKQG
jgi:pilus assembly protein CpaB